MRYFSRDGMMSASTPEGAALWDEITTRAEGRQFRWTEILRAVGVKLAHPNDGWVNRERNILGESWYPQFNDHPEVGDLIALGCPPDAYRLAYRLKDGGYRLVRVTSIKTSNLFPGTMHHWSFIDTGRRLTIGRRGTIITKHHWRTVIRYWWATRKDGGKS